MTIQERKKATKAIILARVSTKEQEEGYSIDAQKYRLQEYCINNELKIIHDFDLSGSLVVEQEKMLNFLHNQSEVIAVVIDKLENLQMCFRALPLMDNLLEKNKIELHFYLENSVVQKQSTAKEKIIWNICVLMNQFFMKKIGI